ncbi:hypothetical protein PVAP13_1KG264539 [Panicum virgatum]|uniref:Uncharacterized protein n=1 Tax=Panicum virgatum TaxID=38727 RepID=A0A8T0XRF9_PANVG|nr:hypothetical protein PVAP13_1KG264539 [Panicum virgatum]
MIGYRHRHRSQQSTRPIGWRQSGSGVKREVPATLPPPPPTRMASRRAHYGRARLSSARCWCGATCELGRRIRASGDGSGALHPGSAARWRGRVVAVGASDGLWRRQLRYQEGRRHGLGCGSVQVSWARLRPPPSPASPTAGGLRSLAGPLSSVGPVAAASVRVPPSTSSRGLADVGGLGRWPFGLLCFHRRRQPRRLGHPGPAARLAPPPPPPPPPAPVPPLFPAGASWWLHHGGAAHRPRHLHSGRLPALRAPPLASTGILRGLKIEV